MLKFLFFSEKNFYENACFKSTDSFLRAFSHKLSPDLNFFKIQTFIIRKVARQVFRESID